MATAAPEKWETVVNKKKSHVTKNDARKAQQKLLENASNSTLDIRNPLEQSATIYDAFDGVKKDGKKKKVVDNDYQRPGQTDPADSFYAGRNGHSKSISGKGGQQKKKHIKPHQVEIDEAIGRIKKLDGKVLEVMVSEAKTRYPNYPLIWLKEVASWLQLQCGGPAEADVAFISYPKGFPTSELPGRVKSCLESLISEVPSNVIELLLTHCVTSMFTEAQQNKGTMGFRILLHIIANRRQDIVILKMPEIIINKTVSQKAYLSVMWLYSLCRNNLSDGIQVWKSVMLPSLHVRSHAPIAISYLDTLISLHKNNNFTKPILSSTELVEFLNTTFAAKSPLNSSPTLKAEMEEIFTHLMRLTLSDKPETQAMSVFKALFPLLNNEDKAVREKIAEILIFCWSNNKECAALFEKMFVTNYSCSSVLLSYICKRHGMVSKELSGRGWYSKADVLENLATRLSEVLDERRKMGEGSKVGFADCVSYCKQLRSPPSPSSYSRTRHSRSSPSSWKWFIFRTLIYILLISVAVDVYKSKGFKGSTTNRILKRYGMDTHVACCLGRLDKVMQATTTWIRKNGPYYYSKVAKYVDPVIDVTLKYSKIAYEFSCKQSRPVIDYINKTIPVVVAKVEEFIPGFTETMANLPRDVQLVYLPKAFEFCSIVLSNIYRIGQLAINRTYELFSIVTKEIYQLSPTTFDSLDQQMHFAWDKVIEYTPVVCNQVKGLAVTTKDTAVHCIRSGSEWFSTHVPSSWS